MRGPQSSSLSLARRFSTTTAPATIRLFRTFSLQNPLASLSTQTVRSLLRLINAGKFCSRLDCSRIISARILCFASDVGVEFEFEVRKTLVLFFRLNRGCFRTANFVLELRLNLIFWLGFALWIDGSLGFFFIIIIWTFMVLNLRAWFCVWFYFDDRSF